MKITMSFRLALPLLGLGLALGACSSTGTSNATGATTSTAAAGGGAGASTSTSAGGASASGSPARVADPCAAVPAAKVAAILGEEVTGATALKTADRFRADNTLRGCKYLGKPLAGAEFMLVNAEYLPCPDADGVFTDPVARRTDLAGVGDKAKARPDGNNPSVLIDTISMKGDQCLYIRIFKGAPEAKAKELSNALWAS